MLITTIAQRKNRKGAVRDLNREMESFCLVSKIDQTRIRSVDIVKIARFGPIRDLETESIVRPQAGGSVRSTHNKFLSYQEISL